MEKGWTAQDGEPEPSSGGGHCWPSSLCAPSPGRGLEGTNQPTKPEFIQYVLQSTLGMKTRVSLKNGGNTGK